MTKILKSERVLDLLDELDLFAYTKFTDKVGKETNALKESLRQGLEGVVNYTFNEGYDNIRAILKQSNCYEIEDTPSTFDLSFFEELSTNQPLFKKVYFYTIDFLDLPSVQTLFLKP